MQTIGLHVGAGIDAMVSEPTPIGDRVQARIEDRELVIPVSGARNADIVAEAGARASRILGDYERPSRPRRILAWLGMVDD